MNPLERSLRGDKLPRNKKCLWKDVGSWRARRRVALCVLHGVIRPMEARG